MNTKRILRTLIAFVLLFAILGAIGVVLLMRNLDEVLEETIAPIQFSDIADGVYTGSYERGRFSNTLEITVQNGTVIQVRILDDMWFRDEAKRDLLFHRITQSDGLPVDAVSEATVSSIAYMKAIEDALTSD